MERVGASAADSCFSLRPNSSGTSSPLSRSAESILRFVRSGAPQRRLVLAMAVLTAVILLPMIVVVAALGSLAFVSFQLGRLVQNEIGGGSIEEPSSCTEGDFGTPLVFDDEADRNDNNDLPPFQADAPTGFSKVVDSVLQFAQSGTIQRRLVVGLVVFVTISLLPIIVLASVISALGYTVGMLGKLFMAEVHGELGDKRFVG